MGRPTRKMNQDSKTG